MGAWLIGVNFYVLGFRFDGAKEQHCARTILNQPTRKACIHPLSQGWIGIEALLAPVGVLIQPLHQREVEPVALVEELRGMEVAVDEGREEEAPSGDDGDAFLVSCEEASRIGRVGGGEVADEAIGVHGCASFTSLLSDSVFVLA
jgi:hypothetical protein